MDADRFDHLIKSLSNPNSRRGLLRVMAALPLAGSLLPFLDKDAAGQGNGAIIGGGGRRRRRARHDPGKDKDPRKRKDRKKRKTRPPGCTPEPVTQTCAGKCGDVPNRCGTIIACQSCPGELCDNGICTCPVRLCCSCTRAGQPFACQYFANVETGAVECQQDCLVNQGGDDFGLSASAPVTGVAAVCQADNSCGHIACAT